MPPKKIKLLEKTVEKPVDKLVEKPVAVDSDDVDENDTINKKPALKLIQPNKSIILKSLKEKTIPVPVPEPIIKDETEITLDDSTLEEEDTKDTKPSKPNKIIKKVEIKENKEKPIVPKDESSEPKIKQQVTSKSKKNTLLKQQESTSSFDMFGDDKDDYREILINYDYTKNKTLPKITKYEKALLVGKRAKQIEDGANPNIKVMPGQSAIEIAEEELRQRKIPLIIKRPIGNMFEYWKPADMEVFMD